MLTRSVKESQSPASSVIPVSSRGRSLLSEVRWRLGYALVVQTAFQFLLKAWSETLEIFLFLALTSAFLVVTVVLQGVTGVVGLVTATWTQRLAALFLLALALSFLWGDQSLRSVLALLRLPTYLILIAMVVATLQSEERIPSFAWTILGAVCCIYLLTLVEFYFGSEVLGLECADVERCLERHDENWHWEGFLYEEMELADFSRHGGIFNATVIGEAYGMSRLGQFAMLAYALGLGLVLHSGRTRSKLLAAGLVTVVLWGLILSGSRSVTLVVPGLGLVFVALTVLNTISFHHAKITIAMVALHHARILMFTHLAIFVAVVVFWQVLPARVTSPDRVVDTFEHYYKNLEIRPDSWRLRNWELASALFFENPVGGRGFRMFQQEARQHFPETLVVGVHNGYLKVLAEAGLLGALPFLALLAWVLLVMLVPASDLSAVAALWKVVFLSLFIALLTVNLVDTHSEDRYFWIVLAFAAVLESRRRQGVKADDNAPGINRV